MKITDFVESFIFNERLWQVLFLLVTVWITTYLNYYFEIKKENKNKIIENISKLKRTGYLLNQAAYLRYEFEICSNYYGLRTILDPNPDWVEENKRLIVQMPELSNRMYELYGESFYLIDQIQKMVNHKISEKIEEYSQTIFNYRTLTIKRPNDVGIKDLVGLEKYKNENIVKVKELLDEEITKKFNNLNSFLKNNVITY